MWSRRSPWSLSGSRFDLSLREISTFGIVEKIHNNCHFMAAIALAKTRVVAFANNKAKGDVRGAAFIKARRAIEAALTMHKRSYFVGVVGLPGTFRVGAESPLPNRKTCHLNDWQSYERVCKKAGCGAWMPRLSVFRLHCDMVAIFPTPRNLNSTVCRQFNLQSAGSGRS
jgi:hypothetical protein